MQLNGLPGETVVKKTHSVPKRLKGGGGTLNCRLVGFFSGVLSGTFFYDRGLSFYIGVGGFFFLVRVKKSKHLQAGQRSVAPGAGREPQKSWV